MFKGVIKNIFIDKHMQYISSGKEGDVYMLPDKTKVMKIYKPHVNMEKREREFSFLQQFRQTGHVPVLFSTKKDLKGEYGHLIMEIYQDIWHFILGKKNKKQFNDDEKNRLIDAIAAARESIGKIKAMEI